MRVIRDRLTGDSRGFAFVSFDNVGGVEAARTCMEKTKARDIMILARDTAVQSIRPPSVELVEHVLVERHVLLGYSRARYIYKRRATARIQFLFHTVGTSESLPAQVAVAEADRGKIGSARRSAAGESADSNRFHRRFLTRFCCGVRVKSAKPQTLRDATSASPVTTQGKYDWPHPSSIHKPSSSFHAPRGERTPVPIRKLSQTLTMTGIPCSAMPTNRRGDDCTFLDAKDAVPSSSGALVLRDLDLSTTEEAVSNANTMEPPLSNNHSCLCIV